MMNDPESSSYDKEQILRDARMRVEELTRQGNWFAAQHVLESSPVLIDDEESAIELIFAEFVVREESGESWNQSQWLAHYPRYHSRLDRLIKLHGLLSEEERPTPSLDSAESETDKNTESIQDQLSFPIKGYRLIDEVGRGGMGIVYRAIQEGLGRTVAVKVLKSIDSHPMVRERFRKEAEVVASLQHPNIVQIIEIELLPGKEFLTMEYLLGHSLYDKFEAAHQWTNHQKAELILTLARAIHYAHVQGVVHRDLKPANILFTSDSIPKIVDFGLAKKFESELSDTQSDCLIGTPSYMAPEQAAGGEKDIGPGVDIYALGVILYQLLSGRLPFEGKTAIETIRWITERNCEPPSRYGGKVSRDLETICLKCLAKSPVDRYKTAEELADDLERFIDHLPIRARRESLLERLQRSVRRHPQVYALAAAIAIVLMGSSVLLYVQRRTLQQLTHERNQHAQSEQSLRLRAGEAQGAYEESLRKARELVKQWAQVGVKLDSQPGMDNLRRKAFEDALNHYEEVLSKNEASDLIRFEAVDAATRAAYMHMDLGMWQAAERELNESEQWLKANAISAKRDWYLSETTTLLGHVCRRTDKFEDAERFYLQSIDLLSRLLNTAPENTQYLAKQSNTMINLCVVYRIQKRWDDSTRMYVRALRQDTNAILIQLQSPIPHWLANPIEDGLSPRELDIELSKIVAYWEDELRSISEANPVAMTSLCRNNYISELALCFDDMAQVLEVRFHFAMAERCIAESIALRQLSKRLVPENRRIDQYLARGEMHLGAVMLQANRVDEAKSWLEDANELFEKLVEDFPDRNDYRSEWSGCLLALARCHRSRGDYGRAIDFAMKCLAIQERLVVEQPTTRSLKDTLATTNFLLAHCSEMAGNVAKGNDYFNSALKLSSNSPAPHNNHAWFLALEMNRDRQSLDAADKLSKIAVELAPQNGNYWNTRALVLARIENWGRAAEAIENAIRFNDGGSASDWFIKSIILAGNGNFGEAKIWLTKGEAIRIQQSPNVDELSRLSSMARGALEREAAVLREPDTSTE